MDIKTPDDLRDIDSAASKIKLEGARYPERLEKMTGPEILRFTERSAYGSAEGRSERPPLAV